MDTKTIKKPWLDENGKMLKEDELKNQCNQWSPEVWEEYLSTIEVEQGEYLFDNPIDSENLSGEKQKEFYKNLFEQKELPQFKKVICDSMKVLSAKQQKVIFLIFWKNQTLSAVASQLNINKTSVMKLRDRALNQLGKSIVKAAVRPSTPEDMWSLDESLPPATKGNEIHYR